MVQAGKARKFAGAGESRVSQRRENSTLFSLGRQNDSQIGGEQFGTQEGFTTINQTGIQDTSKAPLSGAQFFGAIGFNRQIINLDEATGVLTIGAESVSGNVFDTPPGDASVVVIGGDGLTSDLSEINFPQFNGHRLCLFLNALQTITIKHEPGSVLYKIKTGTGADVISASGEERIIDFVWSITLAMWILIGASTGAGTVCPVICPENDLGDVIGGVVIDWSLSPFHRMTLTGDISVVMNNLPTAPGWHEITVEFLQDGVGGHNVIFLDVFRNTPLPIIRKGTNRYTIVKFYSYFDVFDNILTWQPPFLDLQNTANQGIIHTTMSADQIANLAVGDHIEFDTLLFTNNMTISSGAGQASGIFGGFIPGRTYECDVYISGEGSGNTLNWSAQWFDIANALFIGSEAEQIATTGAVNRDSQFVGKAYFQPTADTDTLEVRITNNTVLTSVLNGSVNTEPTTFATIKDCGQTPEQLQATIDEDKASPPPAPPLIGFTGRMMYYNFFQNDTYGRAGRLAVNGELAVPFFGRRDYISFNVPLNEDTAPSRETMCCSVGVLRKLIMDWEANTLNKTFDVDLMKNDVKVTTLVTIPSGTTGVFQWPSVGEQGAIPLEFGATYYLRFKTTDSLNPSGQFSGSIVSEIFWGGA